MKKAAFLVLIAFGSSAPLAAAAQCAAPQCTKIVDNGADGQKLVLVVLGDGYAAADQQKYNDDVDRLVRDGVFGHDFFQETQNAFNVYRVNLVSNESGVSQRVYDEHGTWDNPSDDTITSTTMKDTALKYIWSGSWAHCWLEPSADTWQLEQQALTTYVPQRDFVVVLLNQDSYGGCGGGGHQTVPRGVSWEVLAHEYGHGVGGLMDEYTSHNAPWPGGTVTGPNCSTVTSPLPWARFVAPGTPNPTTCGGTGADPARTVGAFEGCSYYTQNIFRPVCNCRMRGNVNDFCPVCRTYMMEALYPHLGHDFSEAVAADFSGDQRSDVVLTHDTDLALYRANASAGLEFVWIANNVVPAGGGKISPWRIRPNDRYLPGDFDGDGKADLFVANTQDWPTPRLAMLRSTGGGFIVTARYDGVVSGCWTLRHGDVLLPGDFDGDGKTDLYAFSAHASGTATLALIRSKGDGLEAVMRYEGSLPGWALRSNDRFLVGDFDGDHKADLYVVNAVGMQPFPSWSYSYLGMLQSTGTGLRTVKRYQSSADGWQIGVNDSFLVGDFDADGKADLYAFAGELFHPHIGMLRSEGNALDLVKSYGGLSILPGWTVRKTDRLAVADVDRNGKSDLVAFNAEVPGMERLAALISSGSALSASSVSTDKVGRWNLHTADRLLTADYEIVPGDPDVFIRNPEGFGMLRRTPNGYRLDRIYRKWIYTALYDTVTLP